MQNRNVELPPYAIESVHNALQVLLVLTRVPEQRISELSEQLGFARSTAHRLLSTLAHDGFVEQSPVSKAYRLGSAFRDAGLASMSGIDVLRVAHTHLESFRAVHNETINLLISEGNKDVRFIDGVESTRVVRVASRVGWVRPMHITSAGKLFLAAMSESQLASYFAVEPKAFTDATLIDESAIRAELERVRAQDFALNIGESDDSIHAAAVPVRGRNGMLIAGLATSMPASRGGRKNLLELIAPLNQTANSITAEL
jgi:DNA-binding IclR family transcriptional regulator